MQTKNTPAARRTSWRIWAARIISTVFILFFGLMAVGELFYKGQVPATGATGPPGGVIVVVAFVAVTAAGVVLAWIRKRTGGFILICSSTAMMIWMLVSLGLKEIGVTLFFCVPFLFSGILFVVPVGTGSRRPRE